MVNDKEVKTEVSPFAVRAGEKKVYDGKEGYASINQVIFKINMGYLTEYHMQILEVVNEFGYVTSRQVTQILELRGKLNEIEQEKRQEKVAKWLVDWTKSKVLARYFFQSETGKSSYTVYCLDKIATYLLKERNIPTTWKPTENTKPAFAVKRKLAGNQVIIAYMQKVGAFESVNPNILLFSKKYNVKFKPTGGMVTLLQDTQEYNYIFEVVRRNEEWQNMFAEKAQLYSDFFENFAKNDAGFSEKPQIVFVGEDIKHIAEMFRIIKKVGMVVEDKDMYFTTELRHLEDNLENSISVFEYEKETKKYKVVTKTLELLKPGENNASTKRLNEDAKYNANMIIE